MIDAVQVKAVLERMGISANIDRVRIALNALAKEDPPQLTRGNGTVPTKDGSGELIFWFVLPPASDEDRA
jgi:hypothetical protein